MVGWFTTRIYRGETAGRIELLQVQRLTSTNATLPHQIGERHVGIGITGHHTIGYFPVLVLPPGECICNSQVSPNVFGFLVIFHIMASHSWQMKDCNSSMQQGTQQQQFLSRRNSVRPSFSSVRHGPVLYRNGLIYHHTFCQHSSIILVFLVLNISAKFRRGHPYISIEYRWTYKFSTNTENHMWCIEQWHIRWPWMAFEGHFGYYVCVAYARSVSDS